MASRISRTTSRLMRSKCISPYTWFSPGSSYESGKLGIVFCRFLGFELAYALSIFVSYSCNTGGSRCPRYTRNNPPNRCQFSIGVESGLPSLNPRNDIMRPMLDGAALATRSAIIGVESGLPSLNPRDDVVRLILDGAALATPSAVRCPCR
jgi:hypothetical protein